MQRKHGISPVEGAAPQILAIGWRRFVFTGDSCQSMLNLPDIESPKPGPAPSTLAMNTHVTDNTSPQKLSKTITLKASIAELLLVSKLRARHLFGRSCAGFAHAENHDEAERKAMLARYAQVLAVTCKNWFPEAHSPQRARPHQRQL